MSESAAADESKNLRWLLAIHGLRQAFPDTFNSFLRRVGAHPLIIRFQTLGHFSGLIQEVFADA